VRFAVVMSVLALVTSVLAFEAALIATTGGPSVAGNWVFRECTENPFIAVAFLVGLAGFAAAFKETR
jgi:hypothetical protein